MPYQHVRAPVHAVGAVTIPGGQPTGFAPGFGEHVPAPNTKACHAWSLPHCTIVSQSMSHQAPPYSQYVAMGASHAEPMAGGESGHTGLHEPRAA